MLERIRQYSKDDCKATLVLKDALVLCSANIRAEIVSRLHVTGFANGIRQPIGRMSQKDAGLA